jgi:uncharacterized protein YlxW (UPF0749 family)
LQGEWVVKSQELNKHMGTLIEENRLLQTKADAAEQQAQSLERLNQVYKETMEATIQKAEAGLSAAAGQKKVCVAHSGWLSAGCAFSVPLESCMPLPCVQPGMCALAWQVEERRRCSMLRFLRLALSQLCRDPRLHEVCHTSVIHLLALHLLHCLVVCSLQLIAQLQKQLDEYQSVLPKLLDDRKKVQQDMAELQGRVKQQTEELRRTQRQKQQLEELCRALRVRLAAAVSCVVSFAVICCSSSVSCAYLLFCWLSNDVAR